MEIGLCVWSFTGSHKEAGRAIDPHTPAGLTQLALDNGLASVEFSSFWIPAAPTTPRIFLHYEKPSKRHTERAHSSCAPP